VATLTELRSRVVSAADAAGNLDVTNPTDQAYLDPLINSSLQRLHDVLTGMFQDYQITDGGTTQTITTIATPNFAVPTTVLKIRDVEWLGPTGVSLAQSLDTFAWAERNKILLDRSYCVAGSLVLIRPIDLAVGVYKTWWTPKFVTLVNGSDTYDAINGWEELTVVDVAMQIRDAMEKDVSLLSQRFEKLEQHVHEAASKRVSGRPSRVRRVKQTLWERLIAADLDPNKFQ
jgi:hypothetical protein